MFVCLLLTLFPKIRLLKHIIILTATSLGQMMDDPLIWVLELLVHSRRKTFRCGLAGWHLKGYIFLELFEMWRIILVLLTDSIVLSFSTTIRLKNEFKLWLRLVVVETFFTFLMVTFRDILWLRFFPGSF